MLYEDLRRNSPYNTYMYAGLPPGPVNNPGKASIRASLSPAGHSYIFFVATGKGGHWFASTYAEHVSNVKRYGRNVRGSGGNKKAPRKSEAIL